MQRLESLVEGQSIVLEMVSQGAPLSRILEEIVRWVEAQSSQDVLASILLLDEAGTHLLHGAAPSLPSSYNEAIDGIAIGPAVGSCGTAAFTRRSVIVTDIATDPLWDDFRELALAHDLRACWSTPLINRTSQVVGTFAMYYRRPRSPSSEDFHLIQLVTRTAVLAIEHQQTMEERKLLMERERQALEQAQEANRRKDEFLSIASHELLTPLTSAKANLQIMENRLNRISAEPGGENAQLAEQLKQLRLLLGRSEASLRRLEGLVHDLLDISRIQAGKLEMRMQRMDLTALVDDVVDEVTIGWPDRVIRRCEALRAPETPIWVNADPDRIRQVVTNYLSNAHKYSPRERAIDVELAVVTKDGEAPFARLAVRDGGPGLTPDQQAALFERFSQVAHIVPLAGVTPGLGLGLYISRTIIQRHLGHVGVDSSPGQGSTFWFTLPIISSSEL